jgi:site-specific recombinase XerD
MKNLFDDDDYAAGNSAAIDYAADNIPNKDVSPWDEEWLEEGARAGLRPLYEAFAEFLSIDVASGDATQDTIRAYHREVNYWVKWCEEWNVHPARAKRGDVERYREQLKIQGSAVTTRSHKLSIIRRFYDAAVKHGLLEVNPAATVRGGKDLTPPEEKIKSLTQNALAGLANAIPLHTAAGKRDRAIIALMAVHGLRRVEVFRLNHDSLEGDSDSPALVVQGKGNRVRRIFLRTDTYASIVAYIETKIRVGLPISGALFVAHGNRTRGSRLSRRSLNDIVDGYLSAASLKRDGVSCHALRHTHGTLAVAGGANVEQLRDEMGHANLETTGLYVKAIERVKHNPANFIDVEF